MAFLFNWQSLKSEIPKLANGIRFQMNGKKFSVFQNSLLEVDLKEPEGRQIQNLKKQLQYAMG